MERLTFEGNFCDIAQCTAVPCQCDNNCSQKQTWERLKEYEDIGLTPSEVRSLWGEWNAMMSVLNSIGSYDRLRELAKADKDGRLLVLPCKVGDTVYILFCGNITTPVISERKIKTVNDAVALVGKIGMHKYIGYFLTREEADAALREAKKDG